MERTHNDVVVDDIQLNSVDKGDTAVLDTHSLIETTVKKRTSFINEYLLPVKLTYFLFGASNNGTFRVYLNPFLLSVGMSKSKAGIISGISFLTCSITGPFWGILTDYSGYRKLILVVNCLGSMALIGSLPSLASSFANEVKNHSCLYNVSNTSDYTDSSLGCVNTYNDPENTLFYILLSIMALGAIFFNNLPNYVEAIALDTIKTSPKKASYGGQRVFSEVGRFALYYLTGMLVDRYHLNGLSTVAVSFFVYVPLVLMLVPVGCYICHQYERSTAANISKQHKHVVKEDENDAERRIVTANGSLTKKFLKMFGQLDVVMFMLTALIAGMQFNLFIYFTMLLLDEQMTISKQQASFVFNGLSISNIIMFPLSGKVIKLLRGEIPAMILGVFSHCIRHVVMACTKTYWIMIAIQGFHCFDYALLWSAMMEYVHKISATEIKTTMTLTLRTVHFAVSPFLVNMLGGLIYQKYGCKRLFLWNGILCGLWGVLLTIYYGIRQYQRRRQEETAVAEGVLCE